MIEFLESARSRIIILSALVAALLVIGIYIIGRVRRALSTSGPTHSDLLTNFRDLHARGELSDEEFRTIKSMLGERMHEELEFEEQRTRNLTLRKRALAPAWIIRFLHVVPVAPDRRNPPPKSIRRTKLTRAKENR